jgi:hypothetical protein
LTSTGNGTALLSGTPTNANVGPHAVMLQVRDVAGLTATQSFIITVANVNDAPYAADDTAITPEDTTVSINILANDGDPDGNPLMLIAVSQPSHGTAAISGTVIMYTPTLNFNGLDSLTYTISDGNLTDTANITVIVNAVNDPPQLTHIADQTIYVNATTGPITFTVGDVETPADQLNLSAQSSNPGLVPNANIILGGSGVTRTVTITPSANMTGTAIITVTVSDGSAAISDAFVLSVTQRPGSYIFLPLVVRNHVYAPDLVVERLVATSQAEPDASDAYTNLRYGNSALVGRRMADG